MISIRQERYVPPSANRNNRSIYSVVVDKTPVFRGSLSKCKTKRRELMGLHIYTTAGMTQMQGFIHYFRKKYR